MNYTLVSIEFQINPSNFDLLFFKRRIFSLLK